MRKVQVHRWAMRLGTLLLLVGLGCFVAKAFTPTYVDASGMLHESFFLLPLGYAGLFASLVSYLVAGFTHGQRQHA
ncbi:DUF3955 domain-containing protein [Lacticaseibacillus hegangensis]|uniref:DUF3955 domain-containing protein n=1 Tax=Lacticaseibacillus hegangensis TaxID=2486010 RepID=A0ABW4CVK7_9LACO|nr:DUF3955 domain-containing protein [Lacticaseibacillus hegangensis]